jgi:hypothetical protein
LPLTKCEQCGKLKEVSKSRLARNKHNFCSLTCRNKRSESTKDKISKANTGRTFTPEWKDNISKGGMGRKASESTKAKMSEQRKGEKHPLYGKPRSESTREKLSQYTGEKSSGWMGGISFKPYCPKFNEDFRERVRKFFNNTCQMCGHKWQNGEIKLAVHHINYNKNTCCDPSTKPLFVPVCSGKCHGKTNANRKYWYQHFQELIAIQYGGRCYLPK